MSDKRSTPAGRRNIVALALTSLFNDTATELAYWILPAFLAGPLHAGPAALGWIEGFAEGTASVSRLLSGWWTDRVGRRKPFVFAGYLLANGVKPVLAWAVSPVQVLAIRVADRFAKGIRSAPRDAMLAESAPAAKRGSAFGFRQAMDSLGAILGPLAAFLLLRHGVDFRTIFLLAAIPGAAAVLLVLAAVRETGTGPRAASSDRPQASGPAGHPPGPASPAGPANSDAVPPHPASQAGGTARVLENRRFRRLLMAVSVFAIGNSSDLFLVLRGQQFLAAAWAPLFGLVFNLSYTALAWPAGRLSDRVPRKWLLAAGYLVFAGCYLGFAFAGAAWQFWPLFVVYGVYYALTQGVLGAMVADVVEPESRGKAYGLLSAVYGVLVLLASLIAGQLWQAFGPVVPFVSSAITATAGALLVMLLHRAPRPA